MTSLCNSGNTICLLATRQLRTDQLPTLVITSLCGIYCLPLNQSTFYHACLVVSGRGTRNPIVANRDSFPANVPSGPIPPINWPLSITPVLQPLPVGLPPLASLVANFGTRPCQPSLPPKQLLFWHGYISPPTTNFWSLPFGLFPRLSFCPTPTKHSSFTSSIARPSFKALLASCHAISHQNAY